MLPLLVALAAAGCGTSDPDPAPEGDGGTGGVGGAGGSGGSGGEGPPTVEEICRIWNEGHVENERVPWVGGAGVCDHGTLSDVAIEDTLRRINMFRALAGLPPVVEDRGLRAQEQACAVLMDANQDLSHEPPESWACWTEEGAAGAYTSNLALGYPTPGSAIDGLMGDEGVESLGHRRWLLGFFLGKVGIGFAGKATCVAVVDDSRRSDRAWTAYPPAGPTPINMVKDPQGPIAWSFHPADGIAGAEVSMQRMPGGEAVEVESWILEAGNLLPNTIAWQPPPVRVGESYRITISRPEKEPVIYDVDLVHCPSGI